MTPAQLLEAARQRYNAVGDTFYSDAMLLDVVYQASQDLAKYTGAIKSIYTTVSVAGEREYDFPTNAWAVKRIEYDGEKLDPSTFVEDDAITLEDASTPARGVPRFYQVWNTRLFLRPVPDTSALTIKIYTLDRVARLATISDTITVPEEYHIDMLYPLLESMALKNQDYGGADRFRQRWQQVLIEARKFEARKKRTDDFTAVSNTEDALQTFLGVR